MRVFVLVKLVNVLLLLLTYDVDVCLLFLILFVYACRKREEELKHIDDVREVFEERLNQAMTAYEQLQEYDQRLAQREQELERRELEVAALMRAYRKRTDKGRRAARGGSKGKRNSLQHRRSSSRDLDIMTQQLEESMEELRAAHLEVAANDHSFDNSSVA